MLSDTIVGRLATIRDSGSVRRHRIAALAQNSGEHEYVVLCDPSTGRLTNDCIRLERLDLVPLMSDGPEGYVNTDSFRTTPDEATEWLAFCLLQAGMLFMNTPSAPETREELLRILTARGEREDGPIVGPAMAFFDAAHAAHDRIAS